MYNIEERCARIEIVKRRKWHTMRLEQDMKNIKS
jgi:hypothetical protein